jgi:hypothetical protein
MKHSAAPLFSKKLEYFADGDVSKVTWSQEMVARVPKF